MKRCFVCIIVIILLLIVGCSNPNREKGNVTKEMDETILKTNKVIITDIIEDMYTNNIDICIPPEETSEIIDALSHLTQKTSGYTKGLLYSLSLFDSNNVLINQFFVDAENTIGDINGNYYQKAGEVLEALSKIESRFNLTTELWTRKPGRNYFGALSFVNHGSFYEITDNNFIEGLNISLTPSDIGNFILKLSDITFSDYPYTINNKYNIEFYTQSGGIIYLLYVDDDLNIYTDKGYKLINSNLSLWIKNIIH